MKSKDGEKVEDLWMKKRAFLKKALINESDEELDQLGENRRCEGVLSRDRDNPLQQIR